MSSISLIDSWFNVFLSLKAVSEVFFWPSEAKKWMHCLVAALLCISGVMMTFTDEGGAHS